MSRVFRGHVRTHAARCVRSRRLAVHRAFPSSYLPRKNNRGRTPNEENAYGSRTDRRTVARARCLRRRRRATTPLLRAKTPPPRAPPPAADGRGDRRGQPPRPRPARTAEASATAEATADGDRHGRRHAGRAISTFHMITHSDDGPFWSVVKRGMEAAGEDLGVNCVWLGVGQRPGRPGPADRAGRSPRAPTASLRRCPARTS